MGEAEEKLSALHWSGIMTRELHALRLATAVVLSLSCLSLVVTRTSTGGVALPDGTATYIIWLLAPVTCGTLLLGTIPGVLLGLLAGTLMYLHARYYPMDFFEFAFITPFSALVPITISALLLGLLFSVVLRNETAKGEGYSLRVRAVRFLAICLFVSLLYSVTFMLFALPIFSTAERLAEWNLNLGSVVEQVIVDAAIMTLLCTVADFCVYYSKALGNDIGLRLLFTTWLSAAVVLSFMVTTVLNYLNITYSELVKAERDIRSEVNYLCYQIEHQSQHFAGLLLRGYSTEITGTVVLASNGVVVSSDDVRFRPGTSLDELLDADVLSALDAGLATGEMQRIIYSSPDSGTDTLLDRIRDTLPEMEIAYLIAGQAEGYTVFVIQPAHVAYADRFAALGAAMLSSGALLLAVFVVVYVLLDRVIARRIDRTNELLSLITSGDLEVRIESGETREFKSLSEGINATVDALKRWIAEAETRLDAELSAAKAIQEAALPRIFPPFPEVEAFDLYASMNPAREVGGDFYDFFLINDSASGSSKLGFVIADVSGKGIPAALFMMKAKALIRDSMVSGLGLGDAISNANHQLCDGNKALMFVTAWIGILDYSTGSLEFVNAGHNRPFLRQKASLRQITERSGLPLAIRDGAPYTTSFLELEEGDQLILYTDGVTEAMNTQSKLYGDERLEKLLQGCDSLCPSACVEAISRDVDHFSDGAEQSDDITILVLELNERDE